MNPLDTNERRQQINYAFAFHITIAIKLKVITVSQLCCCADKRKDLFAAGLLSKDYSILTRMLRQRMCGA